MTEFMGLLHGVYDAKAEGFLPGGASLHNCMTAHGPDADTWERAIRAELKPHKIEDTMAFMFESRYAMRLTRYAIESSELQHDYFEGWQGLDKHFSKMKVVLALWLVSGRARRRCDRHRGGLPLDHGVSHQRL